MRFLDLFGRQQSARIAQHRLKVLLMHERSAGGMADLIPLLRDDILAAISRHMTVHPDKVHVRVERGDVVSLLEIDVEIPTLLQRLMETRTSSQLLARQATQISSLAS